MLHLIVKKNEMGNLQTVPFKTTCNLLFYFFSRNFFSNQFTSVYLPWWVNPRNPTPMIPPAKTSLLQPGSLETNRKALLPGARVTTCLRRTV